MGMVIFTFYLRMMISEKEITVLTILGFLLILAIAIQVRLTFVCEESP